MNTILFQTRGATGEDEGWLASGLDVSIDASLRGRNNSAILAEYGYEHNPDLPNLVYGHEHLTEEHTRRASPTWRLGARPWKSDLFTANERLEDQ